jgi:hypothetical protein
MPVLCFVAVHALTSVFFDARTYTSPMTSSGGPRGTATLGGNGEFRKVYINAGLQSFLAHPVVGTGFGSFRAAAAGYLPAGFGPIYGVYDIWVDALMSGGLLYGLHLVAASLGTFAMLVRVGWRAVRSVSAETPMTVGAVVAAAALAGHFAFDLDSYYLQLMGLLGMLLGLAYSLRLPRAEP